MIAQAIRRELAACNGGPGLTEAELCACTGADRSDLRSVLSRLMFETHEVTCVRGPDAKAAEARFVLGDPTRELVAGKPLTAVVVS